MMKLNTERLERIEALIGRMLAAVPGRAVSVASSSILPLQSPRFGALPAVRLGPAWREALARRPARFALNGVAT